MNFDKTTTAETPLIRIVDDEERMRESLAFMLKHEGFECCVYPTAESFLKGDTPSRPGCLLLDVQMDGSNGRNTFRGVIIAPGFCNLFVRKVAFIQNNHTGFLPD